MTTLLSTVSALSDADLMLHVTRLAADERNATARLVASLAEFDSRRLYLAQGCSSLFTYCTQVLHVSEHAAYGRIEAARAARRFPILLDRLASGSLTLTAVGLLAPHVTPENHREVLDVAAYKTKREVELLVARLRPQAAVATSVRKLPGRHVPTPAATPVPRLVQEMTGGQVPSVAESLARVAHAPATACVPSRPSVVAPLTPGQYKVQVTLSAETIQKLRRVQDLMRHTIPNGDAAIIFDRALTLLLAQLERTKLGATERPRAARELALGSRRVPSAVRRAVWRRDGGRCAFVGAAGRCTERGGLEFHHVVPYAAGGEATVDTIELRCRAHNLHEAVLDFGPRVARTREGRGSMLDWSADAPPEGLGPGPLHGESLGP
jgi:hypothetical protein